VTSKLFKLVYLVPQEELAATREALFAAGARRLGDYEQRSWFCGGAGTFLAAPAVAALREAHPDEEVAFDVHPLHSF